MIDHGTVVIVDDDNTIRLSLLGILEIEGYEAHIFENGRDALLFLRDNEVDIFLTDIRMPEMNGIELLGQVLAITVDVPVILMTAYSDFDQVVEALKKGAFDFIHKPYEVDYLLRTLDKARAYRKMRLSELSYKHNLEKAVIDRTRELENAHRAMLQSEKLALVGQLSAGIAHEINNPVGFISSNIGSLQKFIARLFEYVDEVEKVIGTNCSSEERGLINAMKKMKNIERIKADIPELINESLEGVERIKDIIKNLKSFSRADDNIFIETDLNDVLSKSLSIVKNEIKYVASVVTNFDDLPSILCNPNQISQVFMNILVNAAHAISSKGEIAVRTWHDENDVFVTIADTGSGMPNEIREKIFEPFFTTKESGKGTGLGLSISYDIVKKHSGEITVESTLGEGTTFKLKFPIASMLPSQKESNQASKTIS
jgi:signal transduction histidine kinase